jgi:hypothetical protein
MILSFDVVTEVVNYRRELVRSNLKGTKSLIPFLLEFSVSLVIECAQSTSIQSFLQFGRDNIQSGASLYKLCKGCRTLGSWHRPEHNRALIFRQRFLLLVKYRQHYLRCVKLPPF